MTNGTIEQRIARLAAGVAGFTEADAFVAAQATTSDLREAVRAVLQDLVARGLLRREGARFWGTR